MKIQTQNLPLEVNIGMWLGAISSQPTSPSRLLTLPQSQNNRGYHHITLKKKNSTQVWSKKILKKYVLYNFWEQNTFGSVHENSPFKLSYS